MADLTSQLLAGINPVVGELKIYGVRIADMNDAQCRLALMWYLSNVTPPAQPRPDTGPSADPKLSAMFGPKPPA